ncbi:MAG: hypothetical protein AB8H80_02395 [Planctomycetota bacterium]
MSRREPALRAAYTLAALVALVLIAGRLAWLGDDAYITLRSVESFVRGNGLRWNPDDRVQVYTHPLWMFVLSAGRAATGELYVTTLAISMLLSSLAALCLLLRAKTAAAVAVTGLLLVCARAFSEYMTSGLETPLTFLLLAAFVGNYLSEREPAKRYALAVLLANLLALNRMDLALLCLPPVLATMRGVNVGQIALRGLVLSLPFVLWLGFAGLYYGSPLPVTAHAKAFGVGIAADELAAQGGLFLLHTMKHDPALLLTVVVGSFALLVPCRTRWLGLGALCYVAYVVKVGGGFMQGRFLLPPFVVVVACMAPWLSGLPWSRARWLGLAALGAMLAGGLPAWLCSPASDLPLDEATVEAQHGIVDERAMYYRELGYLSPSRAVPVFGALEQLAFPEGRQEGGNRWLLLNGAVGAAGFGAGDRGHVMDPLLCDPLIARLPARDPDRWRIGHVLRRIPEGYWESLAFGGNRIHHAGLHRYYGALRSLTRDPVFDGDRLATLWSMALGRFDDGLRQFVASDYYSPPRLDVAATDLAGGIAPGTFWFDDPRVKIIYEGGIALRLAQAAGERTVDLQLFGLVGFRCRFVQGGEVFGEAVGKPLPPPPGLTPLRYVAGVRTERFAVPDSVTRYDTLWIDFVPTPDTHKATGPPGVAGIVLR